MNTGEVLFDNGRLWERLEYEYVTGQSTTRPRLPELVEPNVPCWFTEESGLRTSDDQIKCSISQECCRRIEYGLTRVEPVRDGCGMDPPRIIRIIQKIFGF